MLFGDRLKVDEELQLLWREMNAMKAKSTLALELPPPCFHDMQGEFLRYSSRKAILVSFPVLAKQLNPIGVMQGGYIAAAFDNTLGPLSYLATQKPAVTLDMTQTYLRAARLDEKMYCEAEVITRGLKGCTGRGAVWEPRSESVPALRVGANPAGSSFGSL